MSAAIADPSSSDARWIAVTEATLPPVLAIEPLCYSHPWTPGNFRDAIQAGYAVQALVGTNAQGGDEVIGYFVAMLGVDEVHLLNFTIAPAHQRQGWAPLLMQALTLWAQSVGATQIWLEVRASNARAISAYHRCGFEAVGTRRGYYPLSTTQREDACVMRLALPPTAPPVAQ